MTDSADDQQYREFSRRALWLALSAALVVGVAITVVLWGRTTAEHKDAFDIGWKSSAAVLAILAAVISVDRLRLSQHEHRRQLAADGAARDDAIARRVTDLSAKASEQLGSDKAAVRIGGLTDLERLAQAHPEMRQVVVDRICAYLRAPFVVPELDADDSPDLIERRLELDVRQAAQKILQRHLFWYTHADRPEAFWDRISLNLRHATLVEFDFSYCRCTNASFNQAKFYGAFFDGAYFNRTAIFTGAKFHNFTTYSFKATTFASMCTFRQAQFEDSVEFDRAIFAEVDFSEAKFDHAVNFSHVRFEDVTTFEGASFCAPVSADRAYILPSGSNHSTWPPGWSAIPTPENPSGLHYLTAIDGRGADYSGEPDDSQAF